MSRFDDQGDRPEKNVDDVISGPDLGAQAVATMLLQEAQEAERPAPPRPTLLAIRPEDLEASGPDLGKFFEALAAAQGEMRNALAAQENSHFGSNYADLGDIVDAIKEPLAKHKIARVQYPITRADGAVGVRTQLGHASGQWVACTIWCKTDRPGAQALGSVITYLRRYSLAAAAGVAPEDDDGEAAEGRGNGQPQQRRNQPPRDPPRERERQPTELERKQSVLSKLMTAQGQDEKGEWLGLGWSAAGCAGWSKRYFGPDVDQPGKMNEQQVTDATTLAMALHAGRGPDGKIDETAYRAELERLQAAGRVLTPPPEEKKKGKAA